MDNKLQELTRKLYEEGLEKGRAEAGTLVEDAQKQAAKIIADAKAEAAHIVAQAGQKAEESSRNTATEVALASRQSMAALRKMIETMVSASTLEAPVAKLSLDTAFIRDMILKIASGWNGTAGGPADLQALLPAAEKERFEKALAGSLSELLAAGVELKYSSGVRSGFKIGPREGGYYISFTDADFRALVESYLRPGVAEILFNGK